MKSLFTIAFALFVFQSVGQFSANTISNTKWKGQIQNPQILDIVLKFKTDSLIVTSAEGMELEIMVFTQARDTLKLKKLNGQSPCDHNTEGSYQLEWSGDKLLLRTIIDDCTARSRSITSGVGYFRVQD